MKGTEHFKQAIKEYLDGKARTDELFAVSYAKENKNLHDAHYVCPADLKAGHDKYQNKVRILQEQEERKEQMKRAREKEVRFRELKGKFFGLEFTDGTIVVRELDSVEAYYDEGNALHHCVGQCEYYLWIRWYSPHG